jgi:DNA repair exonuclease SbcCD nuclease subunit
MIVIFGLQYRGAEKMVRIAHISDSHLGCSLFQLSERREDARACFKKAIDMAMRHSPDLIVHTGDVYHDPMPLVDDQNFVIEVLKELKDKVPVYIVQGNHDHPYGYRYNQSTLRWLEVLDLIKSTGDTHHACHVEEFDGKKVETHLVSWCPTGTLDHVVQHVTPKEDIALFFAHDISTPMDRLPIHFNYYGCGHKHAFVLNEEYDFGRPGSTCIVNWSRDLQSSQKLIILDVDNLGNEYTVESLNDVREFKLVQGIDITGKGCDEVTNVIKKHLDGIKPKKEKPIIIMQVNGFIDAETERGLQRTEILRYGEKQHNPLFLHIEPNWECVGPRDIKLSEPLNVQKSIEEYLEYTKDPMTESIKEYVPKVLGGDAA